jgi:hypothetical protein
MLDQPFHTGDDYYDIEAAIRTGHVDYARERLRDTIQENPDAEAWYLAALVALTPQQQMTMLKKALALNPHHERAQRALEQAQLTDNLYNTSSSLLVRLKRLLGRRVV